MSNTETEGLRNAPNNNDAEAANDDVEAHSMTSGVRVRPSDPKNADANNPDANNPDANNPDSGPEGVYR